MNSPETLFSNFLITIVFGLYDLIRSPHQKCTIQTIMVKIHQFYHWLELHRLSEELQFRPLAEPYDLRRIKSRHKDDKIDIF